MEDRIIADHRFHRSLRINLFAAFASVVMPVAIQVADPIENILEKNLTLIIKQLSGVFANLLKQYASQHYLESADGVKVPWIDENLHPFTGEWLARHIMIEQDRRGIRKMRYLERGKDYNHSLFCDLILSGLLGIGADEDGRLSVRPLIPEDWGWFCVDNLGFRGELYRITYDRDGSHYGGEKGLRIEKQA